MGNITLARRWLTVIRRDGCPPPHAVVAVLHVTPRAAERRRRAAASGVKWTLELRALLVDTSTNVTQLLRAWAGGDPAALETLTPLVYAELHRMAARAMAAERPDHTLQPTALVHEAFVRLMNSTDVVWDDRAHFFALSARLMRRILVDFARARQRHKRGGGGAPVPLDDTAVVSPPKAPYLVALDDALTRLAEVDARKSEIVELRFFGGLSVEETADVLKLSRATVMRDWKMARLWLLREIRSTSPGEHRALAAD